MRYTVRTAEGELTLPSREELQRAFAQGLVGPEDEVREEGPAGGTSPWRKVGSLAGMRVPPPTARAGLGRKQLLQVLGITVLGAVSFRLVLSDRPLLLGLGAAGALILVGWLFAWTRATFQLRRRPGR